MRKPGLEWTDRQPLNLGYLKARFSKLVRFLSLLCLTVWAAGPRAVAQTPAQLDIQTYAGLSITGAVGTVYSIEYVTDLAQTNNASALTRQIVLVYGFLRVDYRSLLLARR